ncbi:MAG: hypothetical protein AABZ15_06900 [Nitrospirota bacterium]
MKITTEDLVFAAVSLISKLLFFAYSVIITLVVLTPLFGGAAYVLSTRPALRLFWMCPVVFAVAFSVLYTLSRPRPEKDNPFRKYIGWAGKIEFCIDSFIAWIGRMKYFTSPVSLTEDPGSYKITGAEIRELIDGQLQAGDILLRGYDGYLDGIMIRLSGGGQGMGTYFSHAALYLGKMEGPQDKAIAARRLQTLNDSGVWVPASEAEKNKIRNDPRYYEEGRQMVVHAMTRGVFVEDILTFLRCDYLVVLRLHDQVRLGPEDLRIDRSLIKDLQDEAEAIHVRLMRGESVSRTDVIKIVRTSALGKIGSCYDFQFNSIKMANRFSCSEFVYYCFKSVHCYFGLEPKIHAFLKFFFRRNTITPADIYDAADSQKKLKVIWTSSSLKQQKNPRSFRIAKVR